MRNSRLQLQPINLSRNSSKNFLISDFTFQAINNKNIATIFFCELSKARLHTFRKRISAKICIGRHWLDLYANLPTTYLSDIVYVSSMVELWIGLFKKNVLKLLRQSIIDNRLLSDITIISPSLYYIASYA